MLNKPFQKIEKGILPTSCYEASIKFVRNLDKGVMRKKKNYLTSLVIIDEKILTERSANET